MTIKKLTVIAAAGAVLLAGAIGISMKLTSPHEMAMEVPETPVQGTEQKTENDIQTLSNMANTPLYYDETERLLLPLRNVMEGLGGTVTWNKETKMTEVSYRGRVLALKAGEEDAFLNGYEITLPVAAEVINGCLYADEQLISAYYTGDVDFNIESRQVTLRAKDNTTPVVAVKDISGEKAGRSYCIEVPVIIGLNDSKYEISLNSKNMQEMQAYADAFMAAAEDGLLQLELHLGLCSKNFVSLFWEGAKEGTSLKLAENINLLSQKTVTLADLLSEEGLQEVKAVAGAGWTEDRFYLDSDGSLVLLKGSNENSLEIHHWTTEGKVLDWKNEYKELFKS